MKSVDKKPKFASQDRILWKNKNSEIRSLSPSDAAILLSHSEIAKLIPRLETPKRRLPSITPNHAAVVLWIRVDNNVILLGSDLENTKEEDMGWRAILSSNALPQEKAEVFKIPHHGSYNADNPEVWQSMVDSQPFVALTPYQNGGTILPTDFDIQRIHKRTTNAYITARFKEKKVKTEYKNDKLMEGCIKRRRYVHNNFGYVRLWRDMSVDSSDWNVNLYGGASKLENIMQSSL